MSSRAKLSSVLPNNRRRGKRHKNGNAGNSNGFEEKLVYCDMILSLSVATSVDCFYYYLDFFSSNDLNLTDSVASVAFTN